jgi:hypothetical protein
MPPPKSRIVKLHEQASSTEPRQENSLLALGQYSLVNRPSSTLPVVLINLAIYRKADLPAFTLKISEPTMWL